MGRMLNTDKDFKNILKLQLIFIENEKYINNFNQAPNSGS